jgi:3-(methylthio)propanoyl-CoA dehydrogenase
MNLYSAPLAEIRFVVRELNDVQSLAKLPDCKALADTDLTERVARFASGVLAPLDKVGDRDGARWTERGVITSPGFAAAYREFVAAGWNNIDMPARYGGQELPVVLCSAVREMFAAVSRAKSPDIVTRAARDAIESRRPRTRYGHDVLCFIARWVSDRTFDRVIFRLWV